MKEEFEKEFESYIEHVQQLLKIFDYSICGRNHLILKLYHFQIA